MVPSDEIPPSLSPSAGIPPPAGGPRGPADEPSPPLAVRTEAITHTLPPLPRAQFGARLPVSSATPGRLGWIVVLFVSTLAFLLASFPARNSDLWMHLAAGRLLAEGGASPGMGPEVLGDFRTQQSWLYNLLLYGLHAVVGGTGLVLVKALLVVGLALILLRLSRAGAGWWIPASCTVLAMLAMSTRLLLQPATPSYFFLALTLWLLHPGDPKEKLNPDPSPSFFRVLLPRWPLLVLFLVWANMDSWFVLGLVTVALVEVGGILDDRRLKGHPPWGRSLLYRAASFALLGAVCLLNPSGVLAFAPPPQLGWLGPSTARLAAEQVTSPFQRIYFRDVGVSPAALAYFPLLGLGLLSFVLNLPRWRWQRFLPWLGLALLSVVQVRTIPFFAVVAGPVLAWNLQELLAALRARRSAPGVSRVTLGVPLLVPVILGLVLLVCAWPGWLQAPPFEPRRWAVETPPSLEQGAAVTRRWHQEGKLGPDTRGLHLSPETASAFAWFCPEENGVLDDGLASALLGAPSPPPLSPEGRGASDAPLAPRERGVGGEGAPDDWAERMRAAGVSHVIVYSADRGRLFAALDRLLADPVEWPLLYLEGDLAVFGWRGAAAGTAGPFGGWQVDLNRLAFHPAADKKAPRKRPEREPESRLWWEALWIPAPPRPIDRDEATLHLFHAEALRRSAPGRHLAAWQVDQSAALIGAASGWMGAGDLLGARVRLAMIQPQLPEDAFGIPTLPIPDRGALKLQEIYIWQRDDTPPALLYLAVRAARRALAVNPDDAQAYLVLGESYLRLLHSTRERAWGERLPEIAQLRRVQASAALNQAVALKPDLAKAHLSLGGLYRDMGYHDLALSHLGRYLQLVQKAGPPQGPNELLDKQQAWFEQELGRLAQEVAERENSFLLESANARVLERAMAAMQKGLAGKARDLLLESDVSAFGPRGMLLELELLLGSGRPREVREWLAAEHKAALGASSYHWLRAQALAASGDYALAEEECAELGRALLLGQEGKEPLGPREMMALVVSQVVLDEQPEAGSMPQLLWRPFQRGEFRNRIARLAQSLRREADVTVLRGLLALEEGEVEEAEVAFRLALGLWQDEATELSGSGLDFSGRVIALESLKWLE